MGSCGACYSCGKHIIDYPIHNEEENTITIPTINHMLICDECSEKFKKITDVYFLLNKEKEEEL